MTGYEFFSHLVMIKRIVFWVLIFAVWLGSIAEIDASEKKMSIYEVAIYASEHGINATYNLLEKHVKNNNKIEFLDLVKTFDGKILYISSWTLSLLGKNGFFITSPIGNCIYFPRFRENEIESFNCPESHVSNWKKIWSINHSLKVTEEWSCGSKGCFQKFGFFESREGMKSISEYCSIEY